MIDSENLSHCPVMHTLSSRTLEAGTGGFLLGPVSNPRSYTTFVSSNLK